MRVITLHHVHSIHSKWLQPGDQDCRLLLLPTISVENSCCMNYSCTNHVIYGMYTSIQHSMLLCLKLACSKELLCHIYLCNFSGIILFTTNNVIWMDINKIVYLSVHLNNTVCFFSNNTENENLETVWQGKIRGTCLYLKLSYIFIHSIETSCKRLVKMKFKLKQLQSTLILNFVFLLAWGELQLQCLSQHKRKF